MGTVLRVVKWGLLPLSIVANIIGYSLDAQQIFEWGIPSWGWYIIGYLLIVLFFGAIVFGLWHDNKQLKISLQEAKRYEVKTQRIEIISKEKYPSEILRIFDDMRRCLSEIIESSDNIHDITTEKLLNCTGGTPHELYLALHQKTIDDNVNVTFSFYKNFRNGIGLIDLQGKNDKWKRLVEELETNKKDIPDQQLIDSIIAHYDALNGVNAIRLFYRYMGKHGATDLILRAVEPFRPGRDLLDQTMTRITKRILELKLGEEPKWEMKYFRSDK